MAIGMDDLPIELLSEVILLISRPKYLASLALVSRKWHQVVSPHLYYRLDLEVGFEDQWERLSCFKNNSQLHHTREVYLRLPDTLDIGQHLQLKAQSTITWILDRFPRDTLEKFTWDVSTFQVSADNMVRLLCRHRSLKRIQFPALNSALFNAEMKQQMVENELNLRDWRQAHLLRMDDDDSLAEAASLLPHMTGLELLNIENCEAYGGETNDDGGLAETHSKLHQVIFGRFPLPRVDSPVCLMPHLTEVHLIDLDLGSNPSVWTTRIDFPRLQTLILRRVQGAHHLLNFLAVTPSESCLEYLEVVSTWEGESSCRHALDSLLERRLSLRHLRVELAEATALPNIEGLLRTVGTLETLSIHTWGQADLAHPTWELLYPLEDFERLCVRALELRQISCGMPDARMERDEWGEYCYLLGHIPGLITVHLASSPIGDMSTSDLDDDAMTRMLGDCAAEIYGAHLLNGGFVGLKYVGFGTTPGRTVDHIPALWLFARQKPPTNQPYYGDDFISVDEEYLRYEGHDCSLALEPISYSCKRSDVDPLPA